MAQKKVEKMKRHEFQHDDDQSKLACIKAPPEVGRPAVQSAKKRRPKRKIEKPRLQPKKKVRKITDFFSSKP